MEVYLVSNNLYENNISYYERGDIEKKRISRPLSIAGEELAKQISSLDIFNKTINIYSSMYSSSVGSAKYLADRLNKKIIINDKLDDYVIGELGTRSIKMVRFVQTHNFDIKLTGGESVNDVLNRVDKVLNKIINNMLGKVVIFTHKRVIMALLTKYGKCGYNLDDNLIIEYNDKVIYDDIERNVNIIELKVINKKIVDISQIEV
ncbi:MAG: histidine phosphatase family protein [Mollicutes bacterium]|nr:histidine phosphatase family protein [Mollicutes bacterium]